MQTGKRMHPRRSQRGFGYLMAVFATAALGLLLAGLGQVWHTASMREKEQQLLFVGQEYSRALTSYYLATPAGQVPYPATLQELLRDSRLPTLVRHLRKLYPDPITGSNDWGLVRRQGRIVAVHSLSDQPPFKTNFDGAAAAFSGATRYDLWVFGIDDSVSAP